MGSLRCYSGIFLLYELSRFVVNSLIKLQTKVLDMPSARSGQTKLVVDTSSARMSAFLLTSRLEAVPDQF